MGQNGTMSMSGFSVRTINRQTGASEWVRVRAASFDDARETVERMGLVPHEVRIDEPGAAGENAADAVDDGGAVGERGGGVDRGGVSGAGGGVGFGGGGGGGVGGVPPMARGTVGEGGAGDGRRAPTARRTLLISAIFNLVFAAMFLVAALFTCFTFVFAVPLIVLAVYELRYRNMLDEPWPPGGHAGALRTIAVLEIVTIVVSNVPSMVCGVIMLVNQRELEGDGVSGGR
jgi:hypothetical protein